MILVKATSEAAISLINYLHDKDVGHIFTGDDFWSGRYALGAAAIGTLKERGVLEVAYERTKHSKTRYRLAKRVAIGKREDKEEEESWPPVQVGGVWSDVFMKPHEINSRYAKFYGERA